MKELKLKIHFADIISQLAEGCEKEAAITIEQAVKQLVYFVQQGAKEGSATCKEALEVIGDPDYRLSELQGGLVRIDPTGKAKQIFENYTKDDFLNLKKDALKRLHLIEKIIHTYETSEQTQRELESFKEQLKSHEN